MTPLTREQILAMPPGSGYTVVGLSLFGLGCFFVGCAMGRAC